MDGDVAPLDKICTLADKYEALVMVDDSHATGFIGKTGRGTPELHNVSERIDIINSTLGVRIPLLFCVMMDVSVILVACVLAGCLFVFAVEFVVKYAMSQLQKALGGATGGYTTGNKEVGLYIFIFFWCLGQ
jgi:7-keto-8-aminopelargonate synthetase-like enzyme